MPPTEETAQLDARAFRTVIAAVAAMGVVSIAAVILTYRFVYADSSHFLLTMWETLGFAIPNHNRWFGFIASQWIPVAAMKLGLRSPRAIALLYGINLWMNPVLAVAAAWWASGRSREITLTVLLSVLFFFQTTYVVLDNEASVFFWLGALWVILTLRRDFSWWALGLLVPILFTHEALVLALGPILAVLLVFHRRYRAHWGTARYWAMVAGIAVVCALVVVRVVRPGDAIVEQNRNYFVEGALSLPGSPALVLTSVAFGALVAHALRPSLAWLKPAFWVALALLLALGLGLPDLLWPFFHYRARVLNGVVALAVFAYLHARFVWRVLPAPELSVRRVLALAAVVFVFQARMTWTWHRHIDLFHQELARAEGPIDFPEGDAFAEPPSRQFSWSWTSPVRSIVFQAMETGEVRTIMLNADTTIWQPFHPRVPAELPDLSALGVRYGPELTRAPDGRDQEEP